MEELEEGYFYELDHDNLPPRSPDQLYSVKVAMVFEKNEIKVSLRFPSVYTIRAFFGEGNSVKTEWKRQVPALDEKYDMSLETADAVLRRRISVDEFEHRRKFLSFWVPTFRSRVCEENSNRGDQSSCLSMLKYTGMVQWGHRRQVRFLARHQEVEEESKEESKDEEEEKVVKEEEVVESVKTRSSTKRKLNDDQNSTQTTGNVVKRPKGQNKQNQALVLNNRRKKKPLKNAIDRWSAERYKLAEKNMLKIMKAKKAVFGNPILRPALRAEARKLIGDTGLLDHLLKHMAGKLAPGGNERFRRRHNSDGAMEYWLESADLVEIRKQAGVNDSYWTPPPGWKLGDNLTQDPTCTREFEAIREEMVEMKRVDSELWEGLKELWEEVARINGNEKEVTTVTNDPSSWLANIQLVDLEGSIFLLKKTLMELGNGKAKIEKQMMEMTECLSIVEGQVEILKSRVQASSDSEIWERNKEKGVKSKSCDEGGNKAPAATVTAETKAEKIQRLKSGFRIYKPRGTFLWPNMVTYSESDDPNVVQLQTPPSVSSSNLSSVPKLRLHLSKTQSVSYSVSPIKPVPLRFATLSSISEGSLLNPPSPTTPSASLINLNETPNDAEF